MDKTIDLNANQQGIRLLMVGTFPLLQESWMQSKKETSNSSKKFTSDKAK